MLERLHVAVAHDPRRLAAAAFVGWLPQLVVHAGFAPQVKLKLEGQQALLYHLYDAAQLLALAALAWGVVRALWRLPLRVRIGFACVLVYAASYALLNTDLENFLERHDGGETPWRLAFALVASLAIAACHALGALLAPSVALRSAGIAAGLSVLVANHLVLPLDYPGGHFLLAWAAAGLIGMSVQPFIEPLRLPRRARHAVLGVSLLSLLSFVVVPDVVVRGALLRTPGAVAAPFATQVWASAAQSGDVAIGAHQAEWFEPRLAFPPIPAERLPGAPRAPIVILLTLDAFRSDVLEGKAAKKYTPNLTQMSKQAVRFERAWSPASYTMASLRTMFMGAYHVQHPGAGSGRNRRELGQPFSVPKRPYLGSLLHKAGVASVNVRTQAVFSNQKAICRGLREEIAVGERATSKAVVKALIERLPASTRGPLFVYAHILDAHAPYELGGVRGNAKTRYLGEVKYVDAQIGKLRDALRERGLDQRTYLIVTSDHGEAFGEHGFNFHATTQYEEMMRIPLLIEGPGIAPRSVKRAVGLIDIGPTVLSLFGRPTPGPVMGQSLVPFLRGEDPVLSRPLAGDSGRAIRSMLFGERWKAIVDERHGTEEVYDLKEDPHERKNRADRQDARVYFATLRAFFAGLNPR